MIAKIINNQWEEYKKYAFILRLAIFFSIWKGTYFFIWRLEVLFQLYKDFVWWFIHRIIDFTKFSLNLFGFKNIRIDYSERLIAIDNSGGIDIGEPCIGLGVFYSFIALAISWKGWNKKLLWFIPLGLLTLHLMNILRVTILCIISYYDRSLLEFNHDFTFKIIIYSTIVGLWFWWLKIVDKQSTT